jgi:short-subunit dehydrogenase
MAGGSHHFSSGVARMLSIRLKPLEEQTIVVTGASSGIGRATAEIAAERGARLVLGARSTETLEEIARALRARGAEVETCTVDVGDRGQVDTMARRAVERFGGFDTWVNNAGVSAFGRVHEIPPEEQRRLFDTVYWGVVHGSLAALGHLRHRGGAIINVGSVASEVALPLQVPYSAAKFAVKGFTDGLRLEAYNDELPVAVTLIKPGSVDTPFEEHSASHLAEEPQVPPPFAAPELVAEAILAAAETPTRERFVGPGSSTMAFLYKALPGVSDRVLAAIMDDMQRSAEPRDPRLHRGLMGASGGGPRSGRHWGAVGPNWVSSHPMMAFGIGVAGALAVAGVARMRTH